MTANNDWPLNSHDRGVIIYTEFAQLIASPVIELNRAVAVSMAQGPQAALALVDALAAEPSLARYHHLPAVRADLLHKLGRHGGSPRRIIRVHPLSSASHSAPGQSQSQPQIPHRFTETKTLTTQFTQRKLDTP